MNPLIVVGGILLLFFLPGLFLLLALFPRHRWFGPFHPFALPALGVVVSAMLLVLVGTILGFLPGGIGGKGWFQGNQTGAPVIEIVMATIALAGFITAWARGAFPLLRGRRRFDAWSTADPDEWRERGEPSEITLLRDLRLEEERLRKESARIRRRASDSRDAGVRHALGEAADELDRQRAITEARARDVEMKAGQKRYG